VADGYILVGVRHRVRPGKVIILHVKVIILAQVVQVTIRLLHLPGWSAATN
jgi:hypothetical protein